MINTSIKRIDHVSKDMLNMVRIANASQKSNSDNTQVDTAFRANYSSRIRLAAALAQKRFTSVGLGLYKEADSVAGLGRVWLKETIKNEATGKDEEWLVVYTTDEDEVIKRVADSMLLELSKTAKREVRADSSGSSIQTSSGNREVQHIFKLLRAVAPTYRYPEDVPAVTLEAAEIITRWYIMEGENILKLTSKFFRNDLLALKDAASNIQEIKTVWPNEDLDSEASQKIAANPKPEDIPLAEGIKSKNISMDESGGGGTATVTIDFVDPAKGLKFYQEDIPSGGTPPTTKSEKGAPENMDGQPAATLPVPGPLPGAEFPQGGLSSVREQPQVQTRLNREQAGRIVSADIRIIQPIFNNFRRQIEGAVGQDFVGESIQVQMFEVTPQVKDGLVYAFISSKSLNVDLDRIVDNQKVLLGDLEHYTDNLNLVNLLYKLYNYAGDSGIRSSRLLTASAQTIFNPSLRIGASGSVGRAVIYREKLKGGIRYSFVGADRQQYALGWSIEPRLGSSFERPDTGEICRVFSYQDVDYIADDDIVDNLTGVDFNEPEDNFQEIGSASWVDRVVRDADAQFARTSVAPTREDYISFIQNVADMDGRSDISREEAANYYDNWGEHRVGSSLQKSAIDVSDEVPPMGWSVGDSDTNNKPSGAGETLPQQPGLQEQNAPQNSTVLYDSSQDSGPQFQTTIDPKNKSVNVKFLDSVEQRALDEAIKDQKAVSEVPGQQGPFPQVNTQQQGLPDAAFDKQEIPVNY